MRIINQILLITTLILFVPMGHSEIKFSDRVESYYLENGLKVVLIEDRRSPAVVNSIWYKVGSSDEEVGKTGISHILEHMMFKGTDNLNPGEFSSIVKKWAALKMLLPVKTILDIFKRYICLILRNV